MLTLATPALDIQPLCHADVADLADFFEILAADSDTVRYFHPHPLTRTVAAELARREGRRDRYFLARHRHQVVAYSMLRGWDDGFAVPSFGGCTHPQFRGVGLGHALLAHAIAECRAAGASQLRLTVYRDNVRAVRLYRRFGFVLSPKNDREWVGLLDLDPPHDDRQ